jgi:ABC-type multidrug transport system permease subunit
MDIMKYVAYVVASLFIVLGIAILCGFVMKGNLPSQFKVMTGVVLILYGVFRIVITVLKRNTTSGI